ncbi:TPA: helix-turn-helix transcriptional regulator [Providencia rettgeri]|nr:helix-turn-helix transcriptional regulator [Providencia rettgeri]
MSLGQFLRDARIKQSLSGKELGKLINVSQQQVSRYERGKTSISIETMDSILTILDKSWADFCCEVMKNRI